MLALTPDENCQSVPSPPPFVSVLLLLLPFRSVDATHPIYVPHICIPYSHLSWSRLCIIITIFSCSGTSTLTNQNLPNRQQNTEPNHGRGSLPTTATTAPAAAAAYSAYTTLFPDDSPTKYSCGCVFTSVRGDAAEDAICVGSARVRL